MRYALINESTNEVVNVIVLEPDAIWEAPSGHCVKQSDDKQIGDIWEIRE